MKRGAAVAVVPRGAGDAPTGPSYLLALSQMPDRTILPVTSLQTGEPEWVMSFAAAFDDPRFRLVETLGWGRLFRAIR